MKKFSVVALGLVACAALSGCLEKLAPEKVAPNHIVSLGEISHIDQVYNPRFLTAGGGSLFIHHWWSGAVWCYSSKEQMGYIYDLWQYADKTLYDGEEYIKFDKLDNLYSPLKIRGITVGQCFEAHPKAFDFDNLVISGSVNNKDVENSGKEYTFTVSKEAAEAFNRLMIKQAIEAAQNPTEEEKE